MILSPSFYELFVQRIKMKNLYPNFFEFREYENIRESTEPDLSKLAIPENGYDDIDFVIVVRYLNEPDYFFAFYENNTLSDYNERVDELHIEFSPGLVKYYEKSYFENVQISESSVIPYFSNWLDNIETVENTNQIPLTMNNTNFYEFERKVDKVNEEELNNYFSIEEIDKLKSDLESFKEALQEEQREFFETAQKDIDLIIENLTKSATNKTKKQWLNTVFLNCQNLVMKNQTASAMLISTIVNGGTLPEIVKNTTAGFLVDNLPKNKMEAKDLVKDTDKKIEINQKEDKK